MGTVVGTGVLLLVMTACGSAQLGSGSSGGGTSLPTGSSSNVSEPTQGVAPGEVPPDGKPVALAKIDGNGLVADHPKTVWTQGDGRTVGVVGQESGCGKVSASVLSQAADAVKIELLETLPLEKKMCTMDIRFPPLTVQLDQPLGDRAVVLSSRQEQK